MHNSLDGLPNCVIPDANVLLDAAFVRDGIARKALHSLGSLGFTLVICESIEDEAFSVLRKLSFSLALKYDPAILFKEYLMNLPKIIVLKAPVSGFLQVNKKDKHVVAAAYYNKGWILTGDTPLLIEAEEYKILGRTPQDVQMEYAKRNGVYEQVNLIIRTSKPTNKSCSIFARVLPGQWYRGSLHGRFTICEIGDYCRLYYDLESKSWIFRLSCGEETRLHYPILSDDEIIVCSIYDGIKRNIKIKIVQGKINSDSSTSTIKQTVTNEQIGAITIFSRNDGSDHWNGYLRTLVVSPNLIKQETWKALIKIPYSAPNPYDSNALEETLRLINATAYFGLVKVEPIEEIKIRRWGS